MYDVKRLYPRVYVDQPIVLVTREFVLLKDRLSEGNIFQLGPMGCGVVSSDQELNEDDRVYLRIPGEPGKSLNIRARIAWKKAAPGDAFCRYGLEFLWILRDANEVLVNAITEKLNSALRPTGFPLMLRS